MQQWTTESVLNTLKTNPFFEDFPIEFEGKYSLNYCIGNIGIKFYNSVGGIVQPYFGGFFYKSDINSAQEFVKIATPILQDLVNKRSCEVKEHF